MRTPAWLVILGVVGACGSAPRRAPPPIANTAGADALVVEPTGFTDGALWTCQIDDYDPQPCKLARADGGWALIKLLGSQRFRGAVAFDAGGARLRGQYFCPWGDCTTDIDVAFDRVDGGYVSRPDPAATIAAPAIRFHFDPLDAAAFGGAGYGDLTGAEQ